MAVLVSFIPPVRFPDFQSFCFSSGFGSLTAAPPCYFCTALCVWVAFLCLVGGRQSKEQNLRSAAFLSAYFWQGSWIFSPLSQLSLAEIGRGPVGSLPCTECPVQRKGSYALRRLRSPRTGGGRAPGCLGICWHVRREWAEKKGHWGWDQRELSGRSHSSKRH